MIPALGKGEVRSSILRGSTSPNLETSRTVAGFPPSVESEELRRTMQEHAPSGVTKLARPVRKAFRNDDGYVYFLRGANEVKIGWSRNLSQRLETLRNGNAFPVFICKVLPGTQARERQFHKRFAEYRLRGEWFDLRGSLAKYLEMHIRPLAELPPPIPEVDTWADFRL